jgi:hypothetical protein|tara:strand:- start:3358 stop:3648 length:291 start_codon:yes stop_codon:yes gene_type:complete
MSLGNFVHNYKAGTDVWQSVARELSDGQLSETAKEITEGALVYYQDDGEPYSALSCPVHAACTKELFRRDELNYRKATRAEIKGVRKREKRVKKHK